MNFRIVPIGADKAPLVQKIYESSPTYFRRTDRSEVLPHFAARDISDEVPKERQTPSYKKVFCLIYGDEEPIGIVDLHKDHPKKDKCYLGLLLIDSSHQGRGMGRLAYAQIERFIAEQLGCSEILLGVSEDNDVEGFWQKVGFKRNGHHYTWKSDSHENKVFEMVKTIALG